MPAFCSGTEVIVAPHYTAFVSNFCYIYCPRTACDLPAPFNILQVLWPSSKATETQRCGGIWNNKVIFLTYRYIYPDWTVFLLPWTPHSGQSWYSTSTVTLSLSRLTWTHYIRKIRSEFRKGEISINHCYCYFTLFVILNFIYTPAKSVFGTSENQSISRNDSPFWYWRSGFLLLFEELWTTVLFYI